MRNPFLARFGDHEPALVAAGRQNIFESCLHQASVIQEKLDADASPPKMIDDFWFVEDDWRAWLRPYNVKNGILQIPVKGVLLHDFPYQFGAWATGYEYILRAWQRGEEDGNVRAIALVCDSPGGMVAGCFDMVDRIHAKEGRKPLRAYAVESAYSAAYAVASVADNITVSRTGGVGSIGVVTAHIDVSAAMDREGVKITFIHFGKHKVDGNAYEALGDDVKARIQARIDELGEVFVSTVARNRGMEASAIRATEALTFTASQAVSNGLADSIGSLDDAIAAFAADLDTDEEDETMSGANTAVDQAAHETAVTSARAEGKEQGHKEGSAAQKTRIVAIIESDAGKARPKAALSAALKTDMTAEEAVAFLADLPEEKGEAAQPSTGGAKPTPFENAMNKDDNPNLGANRGEEGGDAVPRHERALQLAGKKPRAA